MYAKSFLFIFIFVVLITRLDQLDLGARLSKSQIPEGNTFEWVATPPQTHPCVRKGVRFAVGYDEKTSRIQYLSTQDSSFATREGLHVGGWTRVREDELILLKGWKIVGPKAERGWRIVVGRPGQQVRFSDRTVVGLSRVRQEPPRSGEVLGLQGQRLEV